MNDKDFWAWLTGFWEGEGSLDIGYSKQFKNKRYLRARLSISQNNKIPLKLIKEKIGGKIYIVKPSKTQFSKKPIFTLQINHKLDLIKAIKKMLPFMVFRKDDVAQKLEIIENYYQKQRFKNWTKSELDYLHKNRGKLKLREIAENLNRSLDSISSRISYENGGRVSWGRVKDRKVKGKKK